MPTWTWDTLTLLSFAPVPVLFSKKYMEAMVSLQTLGRTSRTRHLDSSEPRGSCSLLFPWSLCLQTWRSFPQCLLPESHNNSQCDELHDGQGGWVSPWWPLPERRLNSLCPVQGGSEDSGVMPLFLQQRRLCKGEHALDVPSALWTHVITKITGRVSLETAQMSSPQKHEGKM